MINFSYKCTECLCKEEKQIPCLVLNTIHEPERCPVLKAETDPKWEIITTKEVKEMVETL